MTKRHFRRTFAALFASTALIACPAFAQEAPAANDAADNPDIVVTAQKRSESLQNVPISIQALGTKKLDELGISDFKGYAQQLPSVSFQALGGTPGTNVIYMRGVASGGDGNHSGSLPSVGVYLDEQPVTTIGGNLDVHVYDIARIESLSGPQGTLYGASSEAGTIRIITNKPSTAAFMASVDGEINKVEAGGWGGKLDGMINAPLSPNIALRVVGFYQRDAGYIDNVPGTRTFCGTTTFDANGDASGCLRDGVSVNNNAFVEKDYNDTESWGGRAALKVDLNDSWTVTPSVVYQDTRSHGSYGYDASVGDLKVKHFLPEFRQDKFVQAALTIEGKLGNWDVTYAGAYLDRKTNSSSDYTDYSEAYDSLYESVGGLAYYFAYQDAGGKTIDPRQKVLGTDHFKKFSQELRFASPSEEPVRFVGGAFYQYQSNDIHQDYQIANLAPDLSVNGLPGTLWLTQQHRVDRDYAMFGEVSVDIAPNLTATGGARAFFYDNDLIGFFGFGRNPGNNFTDTPYNGSWSSRTGVAGCFTSTGERLRDVVGSSGISLAAPAVAGSPCTNLGVWTNGKVNPVAARDQGFTYRANLTWKPGPHLMFYATASRGYRPGGINRRADVPPYQADYLQNYELGWKYSPMPGVRINGAIYQQDWKSFQFAYLGANSFTEIHNGPNARIRGGEVDLGYNTGRLAFNFGASYTDAKTRQNLCAYDDPTFNCTTPGSSGQINYIVSAVGTRLPITPKWKLASTLRYTADLGKTKPYAQVNVSYQGAAASDIRNKVFKLPLHDPTDAAQVNDPANFYSPAGALGRIPAFTNVNLAFGADWGAVNMELFVQNLFDERGQISRFQQCGLCAQRPYIVPVQPRTIGVRLGAKY